MAYRLPKRGRKNVFVINYGDESYNLPLMNDLPMNFLVRVQEAQVKNDSRNKRLKAEGQVEMMKVFMDIIAKYAPNVAEDITTTQFEDLMEAWSEAGSEEEAEDLGE